MHMENNKNCEKECSCKTKNSKDTNNKTTLNIDEETLSLYKNHDEAS